MTDEQTPSVQQMLTFLQSLYTVGEYLDSCYDGFFGEARHEKSEDECKAYFLDVVRAQLGIEANDDFVAGSTFVLGMLYDVLRSQVDSVEAKLAEERNSLASAQADGNPFDESVEYDENGVRPIIISDVSTPLPVA
jgi:hypothetical protein